jgi:hypothetical protein
MMLFITSDHLRLLLDGTGKPFTEFMDTVLRATAGKLGIPPAAVHTNLRVNLGDGGVDTQIDLGNDPKGYLQGPTLWQFKARRFSDTTEGVIHEEIHGGTEENLITLCALCHKKIHLEFTDARSSGDD